MTDTQQPTPYAGPGHQPGEEYVGPAQVTGETGAIEVEVLLRGHVEPLDGHFHWFGRIAADATLASTYGSGSTVELITPHGRATGRISDVDPWGRFRITGVGRPPF